MFNIGCTLFLYTSMLWGIYFLNPTSNGSIQFTKLIAFCLLFGEMMQAIIMNSFCIGVVYARISRAFVRIL